MQSAQMKARILVIGDQHHCKRSASIIKPMDDGILDTIKKYKPDHTVFLGDTHDGFRHADIVYQSASTEFFAACTKLCPITILVGNHDIETKSQFMSPVHSLSGLRHYWPINLVDAKCVEFKVGGIPFQAVPYCPNGRLKEGLDTIENKTCDPIATFCHQEIDGCSIGKQTLSGGDRWPETHGLGVGGHIHHHHVMKNTSGQVYFLYTGSPYQDKIDESIDKSISLLTFVESDTCPEEHTPVYNRPGYYWHEERIYLDLPVKIEVSLTYKQYKTWAPEKARIYFLKISGTASELLTIDQMATTKLVKSAGGTITKINVSTADTTGREFARPVRDVPTLRVAVYEEVKKKPHLLSAYNDVFGPS